MEEPAGSPGVEEFNTDGTDTTDGADSRRIAQTIDSMLAYEEAPLTLEMLRHGGDSEALRGPGVLAVSAAQMLDVFGLRHIVASLDSAEVSLEGSAECFRENQYYRVRRLVGPCVGIASRAVQNVSVKIRITVCVCELWEVGNAFDKALGPTGRQDVPERRFQGQRQCRGWPHTRQGPEVRLELGDLRSQPDFIVWRLG